VNVVRRYADVDRRAGSRADVLIAHLARPRTSAPRLLAM
jgi:hypothetical protein